MRRQLLRHCQRDISVKYRNIRRNFKVSKRVFDMRRIVRDNRENAVTSLAVPLVDGIATKVAF